MNKRRMEARMINEEGRMGARMINEEEKDGSKDDR